MRPQLLWLSCPECHEPQMLGCVVAGTYEHCEVQLVDQHCLCDPYGAWEDIWEAARDHLLDRGA